jgi:hypothetical protein
VAGCARARVRARILACVRAFVHGVNTHSLIPRHPHPHTHPDKHTQTHTHTHTRTHAHTRTHTHTHTHRSADSAEFSEETLDNFIRSCAGYCVIS